MLEVQFDPPFLHGGSADDKVFAKPGNNQEFIGE